MPHSRAAFARQVLDYLRNEPDHHEQSHWGLRTVSCGTSLCIAGAAVVFDPDTEVIWIDGNCGDILASTVRVNGETEAIEYRAAQLLGLDYGDEGPEHDFAHQLFYDSDENEAIELLTDHVTKLEAIP